MVAAYRRRAGMPLLQMRALGRQFPAARVSSTPSGPRLRPNWRAPPRRGGAGPPGRHPWRRCQGQRQGQNRWAAAAHRWPRGPVPWIRSARGRAHTGGTLWKHRREIPQRSGAPPPSQNHAHLAPRRRAQAAFSASLAPKTQKELCSPPVPPFVPAIPPSWWQLFGRARLPAGPGSRPFSRNSRRVAQKLSLAPASKACLRGSCWLR